ncbi:MAG: FixH family protein [Cryomorphaceae bacterium]
MKFNWGHALAIAFILFAGYILYFVFRSLGENVELVADDYYAQEVAFQSRIDAKANAHEIGALIMVDQAEEGVRLTFPDDFNNQITEGQVTFFRPSAEDLDRTFPLTLDDHNGIYFPRQLFAAGRYTVTLAWKTEEGEFFVTKEIVI